MDLPERVLFFMLGSLAGFILGYIVARLTEIKEEVEEIDRTVKKHLGDPPSKPRKRDRNESGFMRYPFVADIMALSVLVVVVWAAVATGRTNTELREVTYCNQEYLASQAEFLSVVLQRPPVPPKETREALQKYYTLLSTYSRSGPVPKKLLERFPISEEFEKCLNE